MARWLLSIPERFERFWCPEPNTGCWLWHGSRTNSGYGKFSINEDGRTLHRLAHRVSYELHVGAIPEGLTIDHLCRNRLCVNWEHMEPVTLAENLTRAFVAANPTRNRPDTEPRSLHSYCKWGHEFTDENSLWHTRTRNTSGVERVCRACWRHKSRMNRVRAAERRAAVRAGTRIGAAS